MPEIQFTLNESVRYRYLAAPTSRKVEKTSENPAPKTSQMRKTCRGAKPSIELPDPTDSFARVVLPTSSMPIKYVSDSGSCNS